MSKINQPTNNNSSLHSLPPGWKETTLGKVGVTVTGKTPSKDNPDDWGDSIDFITPTDINSDLKLLGIVARKLSATGAKRFQKMIIPPKSVVVTCIGSDMGKVVLNKNTALTNQQINSIKINTENDNDFVYYLLKNSYTTLRNVAVGGSTMPILNKSTFESLKVALPSLPEQQAIAAVLSSLDDKIELLREQNKTLESLAQTIFKEWFVKFNFPGSTGKMIDSELGKIPEGWRVGIIKDFGKIICGKTPLKNNQNFYDKDIPFIKIPYMHENIFIDATEDSLSFEGANSQKNKYIPPNSICVSCIATIGLVGITSHKSQTNQQINSIVPDSDNYLEYLFLTLKNLKNNLILIGAGGSATLNINTSTFENIKIIFPNQYVLNVFHELLSPSFERINCNISQVKTLSTLRDTLLPKLMSGKIRVSGFL